MQSRLITADRIHNGIQWLPVDSTLEIADDGTIVRIHQDSSVKAKAIHYSGVLLPAFVNVHCHLELSHLHGVIPRNSGLVSFLQQVTKTRASFSDSQKREARHSAFNAMRARGVGAVGDVANTTDSLDLRIEDKMHFYSFVECIGFTETRASERFETSKRILDQYEQQEVYKHKLQQSIVAHAPYSVSPTLFQLVANNEKAGVQSIHNQETEAEDLFYRNKSGEINILLDALGIDHSFFKPSGWSSIQTYGRNYPETTQIIFVHNTFTDVKDLRFVRDRFARRYWCLCPNANLYIENRLPDVAMLSKEDTERICIGTDSLASNDTLCVYTELKTLKEHFPFLPWEMLFRWGTSNGAAALNMPEIGKLEPGGRTGIIQLTGDAEINWIIE